MPNNLLKEEIIFQNQTGKTTCNALTIFNEHSADDLGVIVKNYQLGDSYAAEQLRQLFYPLIYKLSHRHSMYQIFGEDAENMAWLLFFEFIFEYRGTDFIRLPGLVRRFLIFRLLRLMQQQGVRWDTEEFLESDAVSEKTDDCAPLQKMINELALKQEIISLPTKEISVLKEVYFKNNTYAESAQNLNCTPRSIRYYRNLALGRLKENLKN